MGSLWLNPRKKTHDHADEELDALVALPALRLRSDLGRIGSQAPIGTATIPGDARRLATCLMDSMQDASGWFRPMTFTLRDDDPGTVAVLGRPGTLV